MNTRKCDLCKEAAFMPLPGWPNPIHFQAGADRDPIHIKQPEAK